MFDVLYFFDHSFDVIFMHDGLGIWMVQVYGWFVWVGCASIWPSMRPWSPIWVM